MSSLVAGLLCWAAIFDIHRNAAMVNISRDKTLPGWILRAETVLPASRDGLFEFFSDAFQLEQITPPWLSFRVLTPAPIRIADGTLIDYALKLKGIPIRWRTEISTWDPPHSFTDRQLRGPYQMWEHLHTFEEVEGGTLVRDQVTYRVFGGAVIHALFVKKDLRRIFEYRQQRMVELFQAAKHERHGEYQQQSS